MMNCNGWLAALLVAACLAGCQPAKSPQELLAEAQQYYSKGDLQSALIQAKNAVQLAPELAEGHYQKGIIYLDLGEATLAEEELRLALSLRMEPGKVVPPLGRALLRQDKYQDVLDEMTPERLGKAANTAEIESLRGDAHLGLRRIASARASYENALRLDADCAGALVGLAKITASDKRPQEGLELVERALLRSPTYFDALLLKGDLLRVLGKPEPAVAAYEAAVRVRPKDMNARLTAASLQIYLDKSDDAKASLDVVLKELPDSPTANYMQAMVEFRKRNFEAAYNHAAQVLKVQPAHVPSVMIAAAAEYAMGEFARAERHLKWLFDIYPKSLYVRKLLAATYSRNGKVLLAIDTLQPALKQAPKDATVLALAGEIYLQAGEFAKATQYLDMAVKLEPEQIERRVAAGASRLASSEPEQAVSYLEAVVAAAPSEQARLLLAMANIRRGNFDNALNLLMKLQKEMPRNPAIRNLKGSAYLGKKDLPKAKRAFEEAMSIEGSYFPAAANLAQLDVREKNFSAAMNRYFALLDRDGNNVQAMLAIADLLKRQPGKAKESLQWIERANQAQPNNPRIVLVLAQSKLAEGNQAQALALANQASTLGEVDPSLLEDAAKLQLEAGGARDALETYQKIARLKPESGEAQLRVASVQYLMGSNAIAKQTLRKALELQPNLQEALILLAKLEASGAGGSRDEALKLVEKVKKLSPNSAQGFVLEGDVEMLSRRYANAVKAYERAYGLKKNGYLAAQLHQAHVRAGKPEAGERVVLEWLQDNPGDLATRQYLADESMKAQRFDVAVPQYEWLAQKQPTNQQVLNNLAWAYNEKADARAMATAERAFRLDETSASAADTFGWVLYSAAQFPRAVEQLARAVALAPNSRTIRYHYAQALAKAGDRKSARMELERILAGPAPFPQQTEAKALLEQLKG